LFVRFRLGVGNERAWCNGFDQHFDLSGRPGSPRAAGFEGLHDLIAGRAACGLPTEAPRATITESPHTPPRMPTVEVDDTVVDVVALGGQCFPVRSSIAATSCSAPSNGAQLPSRRRRRWTT
jgi:hypothetical protein